jgi:PTH1 family peptidyl-tRNA hydrolase
MNLSGESLSKYLRHIRKLAGPSYSVGPENVLIVHDFLDQPFGQLKLKTSGSAGGHNGLKNVQLKLSSSNYHRLRVGIGRPDSDVARFVLQPFSGTHRAQLPSVINNACNAIDLYLQTANVAKVMNEVNLKSGTYQLE